jgi:branched-chain amino acid transport system substrate-binding protein
MTSPRTKNNLGLLVCFPRSQSIRKTICQLRAVHIAALFCLLSAPALADDKIIVGQTLDLSGTSNIGKDFSSGIRTYVDAINQRGGVRGKKIELIQYNDDGDAIKAAANAERLIQQDKADLLLGPSDDATALSVINSSAFQKNEIGLVAPLSGVDSQNVNANRVLWIRANYDAEARRSFDFASLSGVSVLALVNGGGLGAVRLQEAIEREAARLRINVAIKLNSAGRELDTASLATLKRLNVVTVMMIGDAVGIAPTLAGIRRTLPGAMIYGFSTVDHRTVFELAGPAARGLMLTQVMPSPSRGVTSMQREHAAQMRKYRDEPPTLHTLEGYLAARVLVALLERTEGEPSRQRIVRSLRAGLSMDLGLFVLAGTAVQRRASNYVDITVIANSGRLVD